VQQQGDREFFVADDGTRLSAQSWKANVGFANYERALTDSRISGDFLRIFIWTVVFATLSVVLTFTVGLLLAVTMNDPRVRGQRIYRSVLILPYAVPGFIMILIWSSFWNRDFGLINDLTGLDVNWLGGATTAKVAVLITNLWLGFPYMFIVATGALQAIPADLKEAATMDGASGLFSLRKITFPLVLVTTAPLLVATFAFNFNNYNIIYLLTEGGPFSPGQPPGRRHRHPHQLHDPAGLRAQRRAVRLRQRHRHPAVRAHRHHRRHPVPLHPRSRGRALMTSTFDPQAGQSTAQAQLATPSGALPTTASPTPYRLSGARWWREVGWRHAVAWSRWPSPSSRSSTWCPRR
jgi:ABC-type sugar transport system permease subunit